MDNNFQFSQKILSGEKLNEMEKNNRELLYYFAVVVDLMLLNLTRQKEHGILL